MKLAAYLILGFFPLVYSIRLGASLAHQRNGMSSDTFFNLFWLWFWGGGFLAAILPQPYAGWIAGTHLVLIMLFGLVMFIRIPNMIRGLHNQADDEHRAKVDRIYRGKR